MIGKFNNQMIPTPLDERLPLQIQEFWRSLHAEVCWLHCRWLLYRQLFGTSKERIDLLNSSASLFFKVQHDVMLNDIQLSIGKINDPYKTGNFRNLSLLGLAELLKDEEHFHTTNTLTPLIISMKLACEKIKNRRNKWIAHFDLDSMLAKQLSIQMGPSRKEIELALKEIRDAMNLVAKYYSLPETKYDRFITTNGGDSLISIIRSGLRYEQLVKERVISHDDLGNNNF